MKENTVFRPYTRKTHDQGQDLFEDAFMQAVVLENLRRYFEFDFSKMEIRGWMDDRPGGLTVVIWKDGSVLRDIKIDSIICGQVDIEPLHPDAIKHDLYQDIADLWIQRLGFPRDYPRSEEFTVDRRGGITVTVCPCF